MKQAWVEFAPLLASTARGWRKAFDAAMAEHGLSDAKAIPLMTLLRHGDRIPQGVLAERVGIEGATIVRVVDELEKDGLIQRIADDADRRVKLIQLTGMAALLPPRWKSLLPVFALFSSAISTPMRSMSPWKSCAS